MIYEMSNILNKVNTPNKKRLKILTTPTHEAYQTMMSGLDHDFYLLTGQGIKTWDFHTKPLPANHYLLHRPFPHFPLDIEFDLILSQDRFGGLQRALEIGTHFSIPVVHIDHALPPPGMNQKQIDKMKGLPANKRVFVAHTSKKMWEGSENDPVIYYGLDDNIWSGWKGMGEYGLSVVNHFPTRDVFCGWNNWTQVAKNIQMKLVGENPGLSKSASSVGELINEYRMARFFLNTSTWSTLPMSLVEAMLVGCPVITTSKFEAGQIIKHGENGLIADTPEEMIACAKLLLTNYDQAKELGSKGRETAKSLFNLQNFLDKWNETLYTTWKENK